ncbi:hypothetical protein N9226_00810 [bacterium]|nr:hypothetical protein [bacterium]
MSIDLAIHTQLQLVLLGWVVVVALVTHWTVRYRAGGMTLAAVLVTTYLYQGCFTFVFPGYSPEAGTRFGYLAALGFNGETVALGSWISLLGLAGLAAGFRVSLALSSRARRVTMTPQARPATAKTLKVVLVGAAILGFGLNSLRVQFPMSGATLEWARNCGTAGIALGLLTARSRRAKLIWWSGAGMIFLIYLSSGFLSYTFLMLTVVVSVAWVHGGLWGGPSLRSLSALLLAYGCSLLFFIVWMNGRTEFRETISQGRTDYEALLEPNASDDWSTGRAFDLANERLNQPFFIGRMAQYLGRNPDLFENGRTIEIIPLALVPRPLWPEKPGRGGAAEMSRYTGLEFSRTATIGTGPIFGLYVNYGWLGVLLGMGVFGMALGALDRLLGVRIQSGDLRGAAILMLVSIPFCDPYLTPFFIANGVMFAGLASGLAFRVILGQRRSARHLAT